MAGWGEGLGAEGTPTWHYAAEPIRVPYAPEICALLRGCAPNLYHCGMFIIPYGAPQGYEWLVALVALVGLYFAIRSFIRARH